MLLRAAATVLAIVLLFVAASSALRADAGSSEIPASLQSAVSSSNATHTLRVVVFSAGFEHVSSRVYLQWLVPDEASDTGIRLVSSVVVNELSGGLHAVGQPTIENAGSGFRVVLPATEIHGLRDAKVVLVTAKPGEYRVSR